MSNPFKGAPSMLDEIRMMNAGSMPHDVNLEEAEPEKPEEYVAEALERAIATTAPSENGVYVEMLGRLKSKEPSKVRLYVRCFCMSRERDCRIFEQITRDKRMLRVDQSETFKGDGKVFYWVAIHMQQELYDELTQTVAKRLWRWIVPRVKRTPLAKFYWAAKAWLKTP